MPHETEGFEGFYEAIAEFVCLYEAGVQAIHRMTHKNAPGYYRMVGYLAALKHVLETLGALELSREQWEAPKIK
jgi:hypothetical protein